ncbi:hypothetical protein ACYRFS_09225 [Listeria kieliensis]
MALERINRISSTEEQNFDSNLTKLLLLRAKLLDLTRYFEDLRMLVENLCAKLNEEKNN